MSDTEAPAAGGPVPADADGPASQPRAARAGPASAFSLLGRAWRSFRSWRRSRPFWAGIWLIIAGAELLLIPLPIRDMGIILHIGIGGISGILIGAVLIVCALLLWFNPAQHVFYSIVAVLLAIGALVASNLGGFLIGTVLGIVGGSLGFAWMPGRPERRRHRRRRSQADRPDAGTGLAADADPEPNIRAETDGHPDTDASADTDVRAPAVADRDAQVPASTFPVAAGALAALPRADQGPGTTLRAFALIPVLALLTWFASATGLSSLLDPGSAASAAPSACSSTSASPAPGPSPAGSCSPSPAASADPTPDPTTAPSPTVSAGTGPGSSAHAGADASASSASASPSPTPTGTPLPFAVSTAQSTLTASSATITGFAYDGVVTVQTATGSAQMMEFSATSLDLSGVGLTVSQGGATQTTTANSLDLTGNVVLYATELSGDLFGIQLTITPSTPIADILQVLGEAGLSQALTQVVPLPMTNVTTLQPYTAANNMAVSALDTS